MGNGVRPLPLLSRGFNLSIVELVESRLKPGRASLLPTLAGSLAALTLGAPLAAGAFSQGTGLALVYSVLPVAVAAIELVPCLPGWRQEAGGLEFALSLWLLVLTLIAAAFLRFGLGEGLAAVTITFVVADLVSFSVRALRLASGE